MAVDSTSESLVSTSPDSWALAKLEELESSERLATGPLRPVYGEISEVLRSYLGRRFHFQALDLTTSELQSRLVEVSDSEPWRGAVARWLDDCDLVKYAGALADAEDAKTTIDRARTLIERIKNEDLAQDQPRLVTRA